MADISFLVFEDDGGNYRLEGDGPIEKRVRVDMTSEEAAAYIAEQAKGLQIPDEEEDD